MLQMEDFGLLIRQNNKSHVKLKSCDGHLSFFVINFITSEAFSKKEWTDKVLKRYIIRYVMNHLL